jgi:integrase
MSVYKRGDVWWYRFMFRGMQVHKSSKSTSKTIAERLEREFRRNLELDQAGLKEIEKPILFSAAAKDYLREREAHWAPKTGEIHDNSLKHLEKSFGKKLLSLIEASDIHYYQSKRKKEGAGSRTINIEVALLRLVLRKHGKWSRISDEVQMLKERTDIGRELSNDEVHRLLTAAKASASRSLYPAIVVSIHTGLRNHELRLLRWRQVELIEGVLTVGKSKTEGGTGRVVPLSQMALAVLQEWRGAFPDALPGHYVFPSERYGHMGGIVGQRGGKLSPYKTFPDEPVGSWNSAWRTAKATAKVECRWHDLRHTFVSTIAAGGAMDATIMALAGHLSRKMMEKYSHVRNAAKRQAVTVFDATVVQ